MNITKRRYEYIVSFPLYSNGGPQHGLNVRAPRLDLTRVLQKSGAASPAKFMRYCDCDDRKEKMSAAGVMHVYAGVVKVSWDVRSSRVRKNGNAASMRKVERL